jgi:photosystem II stability/assembly factor-like uncharacterized protein
VLFRLTLEGIIIHKRPLGMLFVISALFIPKLYGQIEYWRSVGELNGGLIQSIVVNGDTVFAGGSGGAFMSIDGAQSWKALGLNGVKVLQLVRDGNYLFAACQWGFYKMNLGDTVWRKTLNESQLLVTAKDSIVLVGSWYDGIFRSTDYGETWQQADSGITNREMVCMCVTSNGIVLASAAGASGSGMFRSTDLGISWQRTNSDPYSWNFEGISEYSHVLYGFDFTNQALVYESTDGGLTWLLPSGAIPPSDILMSVYKDNSGLYVGSYHYGVFKSLDEGRSWTSINGGLANKDIFQIVPGRKSLFCATYDGVYSNSLSSQGNWQRSDKGLTGISVKCMASSNDVLLAGTAGSGLWRSANLGKDWSQVSLGGGDVFVCRIVVIANNVWVSASSWYPAIEGALFCSTDHGLTWGMVGNMTASALAGNDKVVLAGTEFGLYRSTNGGATWTQVTDGVESNINVADIAMRDSVAIVVNGTSGFYRSTDSGISWIYQYINYLPEGLIAAFSDSGEFYIGSGEVNEVFKSSDEGATWKDAGAPLANADVNAILCSGAEVFCGLSNGAGVIASTDRGNSWYRSNNGLRYPSVLSLASARNQVFAGTDGGVYALVSPQVTICSPLDSSIGGEKARLVWNASQDIDEYRIQIAEDSMFEKVVRDFEVAGDTSCTVDYLEFDRLYYWRASAVTPYGSNLFSSPGEVFIGAPTSLFVYPNYPNPFSNSTIIRFYVPRKTEVVLDIYDMLGRKVRIYSRGELSIGNYQQRVDAGRLSSGVYFYRVTAGNSKVIKKMVLIE